MTGARRTWSEPRAQRPAGRHLGLRSCLAPGSKVVQEVFKPLCGVDKATTATGQPLVTVPVNGVRQRSAQLADEVQEHDSRHDVPTRLRADQQPEMIAVPLVQRGILAGVGGRVYDRATPSALAVRAVAVELASFVGPRAGLGAIAQEPRRVAF